MKSSGTWLGSETIVGGLDDNSSICELSSVVPKAEEPEKSVVCLKSSTAQFYNNNK